MFPDKPNEFIEEFLHEFPQKPFFSEVSLSLQDWIRAYTIVKNEGDLPNLGNSYVKSFKNCLFVSFFERTNDYLKYLN